MLSRRNRRCLRREIEKRLRSAKDEVVIHQKSSQSSGFSPKANTLLDFVESVEQYAEDVLPPKELGSSNRKPYHLHQFSPQRPSAPSVRPSPSNISIGPEPKRTDPETFRQSVQACTKQTKLSTLSKFPTTSTTSTQASTKSSISHTRTDAIANSGNQHRNTDNHATRAREYINDPNGTILSPRKIKASSALRDPDPKLRSREGSRAKWRETATEPTSHELTEQSTTFYRMLGSQAENDPAATYERAEVTESESGSDFIPEEEDVDEGPSPFQATAGFTGKFPRGWRQRHGRNNLIDHFE